MALPKILILVDHACGIDGPHRNVASTLNALSKCNDILIQLLTANIDNEEPYSFKTNILTGFYPHKMKNFLMNCFLVKKAIKDFDVVYVPTGLKSLFYAQMAHFFNCQVVAGPNVAPFSIKKNFPGWIQLSFMCDAWVEASKFRQRILRKRVKSNLKKKIKLVHHAIDTDKFSPNRRNIKIWEAYGIPVNSLKILFVGRDSPCKGVNQLIEAINILNNEMGINTISYIFVGKISREMIISQINNSKNVYFLGFRKGKQLAELYASADISVVPSIIENFPFVVLEAMSSGLSVIASKVGGIPEQIIDGESGILIDIVCAEMADRYTQNAGHEIAQKIAVLKNNPRLRCRLGKVARKRVIDFFSEQRLGKELNVLFREVISLKTK